MERKGIGAGQTDGRIQAGMLLEFKKPGTGDKGLVAVFVEDSSGVITEIQKSRNRR